MTPENEFKPETENAPQSAESVPFVNPYQDPAQNFIKPPVRFTKKDWLFVAVSILLAWLCFCAYGLGEYLRNDGPSGLGVGVFVTALLGAVYLRLGKAAHINAYSIFYTACTLLLGWSNFFSTAESMYFLNAFVTLGMGALTVFSLSGQLRSAEAGFSRCLEAVGLLFVSIFRYFAAPFRALGGLWKSDRKRWGGVAIGLLCAVPILAIVLALLISADAVFSGIFSSFSEWLQSTALLYWAFWAIRLLLVALLFCSGLYFLTQTRKPAEPSVPLFEKEDKPRSAAPFVTVMVLLCAVYAVFAVIQIMFLFGGAETAAMQGGYAHYARSGFFQLVAVAAINLGAVLLTEFWGRKCPEKSRRLLKILSYIVLALTLVILASAVYRMALYISVYALSILRLLTLWAMFIILIGLFAAGWKLLKPDFRFFRVLLLTSMCTWTLLSLAAPLRIVAEYNVSAYIDRQVDDIDTGYLMKGYFCSSEVLHALHRLRDSERFQTDAPLERQSSLDEDLSYMENRSHYSWTAIHFYDP